jgi:hypothetical protein
MTETLGLLTSIAWALCAAGIAWYCLNILQQITYVTLADGRQQERKLPVIFRLLLPFAPNLDHIVTRPALKKRASPPTASWWRQALRACFLAKSFWR